jgi:NhaP-type Na+/H+ or K+/H+ antiporter
MESNDILYCFVNFWICFIGSCLIGYFLGVMTALLYKHVEFKNHKLAAISLFVSTVYIPFLLSEVLQLSGIVTILFSGIASRRYINKNLSSDARKTASFVFQLMAYLAETSCFCLLGLSVFSQSIAFFKFDIIFWTLLLILIGRAAHVYPLLSLVRTDALYEHFIFIILFFSYLLLTPLSYFSVFLFFYFAHFSFFFFIFRFVF